MPNTIAWQRWSFCFLSPGPPSSKAEHVFQTGTNAHRTYIHTQSWQHRPTHGENADLTWAHTMPMGWSCSPLWLSEIKVHYLENTYTHAHGHSSPASYKEPHPLRPWGWCSPAQLWTETEVCDCDWGTGASLMPSDSVLLCVGDELYMP